LDIDFLSYSYRILYLDNSVYILWMLAVIVNNVHTAHNSERNFRCWEYNVHSLIQQLL